MKRRPGDVALALALALATIGCGGGGAAPSGSAGTTGAAGTLGAGGAGLSGGAGTAGNASGSDGGTPPPICGNQILEGTEICDGARGCPDGQVCAATCDGCVPGFEAPPQTLGLIAAALAAGKIDYPTSLLLRGEALVGDERLPPEYDGDFTLAEDSGLFLELFSIWNNLTPAQQQMLRPYYVRPSDPASVWSQPAPVADDLPDTMPPPIECPQNPATGVADWRYTESPGNHFVVWSCGGGDPLMDPYVENRKAAAAVGDELWDLEAGLGPPRPDANSDGPADTSRIDVYLVRTNECRWRNGQCNEIVGEAYAAASPALPCDGTPARSSGFLLLRLERVLTSPDKLRSDFAHELFHVVSYGRNLAAQGGACGGGVVSPPEGSWLTEASGVWAEWAYTPADDPAYRTNEFQVFQQARTPSGSSLLDTEGHVTAGGKRIDFIPAYGAYSYPVSLSADDGGKPDGFQVFWASETAGAKSPAELDDALDKSFDFGKYFRDFAVRAVNLMLPGDPISPLFNSLDDAIKTGVQPPILPTEPLDVPTMGEDLPFDVVLMPLNFQVQPFTVDDHIRWVQIDIGGADGSAHLALDPLAYDNTKATWTRRRLDAPIWTFCRDDAGDDISQFKLVISNYGHHRADKVNSQYVIRTAEVCPAFLTGFIHSVREATEHDDYMGTTTDNDERQVDNWTFSEPVGGSTQLLTFNASWSSTYARNDTTVSPCKSGSVVQTYDGSGSGSGKTPVAFISLGPTGYQIDLAGPATASYQATNVSAYQSCDMPPGSSTGMMEVQDPYGTIQGFVTLVPGVDQPNHFVGSSTILHSVTPTDGGMQTIDWKVNWDVTLGRHN